MYPNMNMPPPFYPPWMWPTGQSNANPPPVDPATQITGWIKSLEELKKSLKEEKKPDDKKKQETPSVAVVALLMLLLAPITGPIMSKFFSVGLSYLPHP